MTDNQARARAAACVRVPGANPCGGVGEASNMALERPAGSPSLAAAAHRRRSAHHLESREVIV
jgi:hypothetical protein